MGLSIKRFTRLPFDIVRGYRRKYLSCDLHNLAIKAKIVEGSEMKKLIKGLRLRLQLRAWR